MGGIGLVRMVKYFQCRYCSKELHDEDFPDLNRWEKLEKMTEHQKNCEERKKE